MSDRTNLLRMLQQAGSNGVDSFSARLNGAGANPSQRVRELRERGYIIEASPFKKGHRIGRRYVLKSSPVEVSASRGSKRCRECGEVKSHSEFWKDASSTDGLQGRCRSCHNTLRRELRSRNPGALRAEKQRWRKAHPEKARAHDAVQRALARGELVRPDTCTRCDQSDPEAHHPDYSKPLEVEWLCKSCHAKEHPAEVGAQGQSTGVVPDGNPSLSGDTGKDGDRGDGVSPAAAPSSLFEVEPPKPRGPYDEDVAA